MSELGIRTPLEHRSEPSGLAIGLSEINDRGMIDLRGLVYKSRAMHEAVSLAVNLSREQGSAVSLGLSALFLVLSLIFVWRSFYAMRIGSAA